MGVLIAGVWMFALFSRGVLTLGLIALVTGRAPFNMWGKAWIRGDRMNRSLERSRMPEALEHLDELLVNLGASVARS